MSDLKDPRVLFAAERTLLAWNRTSLSFIAFGFLIER
ncbi:MAG: YidH family protein, partial [Pseudomonadota bacterium]